MHGVLEGLSSLRQTGVRPGFVIIDDGWQDTVDESPGGLEAGPQGSGGVLAQGLLRLNSIHEFLSPTDKQALEAVRRDCQTASQVSEASSSATASALAKAAQVADSLPRGHKFSLEWRALAAHLPAPARIALHAQARLRAHNWAQRLRSPAPNSRFAKSCSEVGGAGGEEALGAAVRRIKDDDRAWRQSKVQLTGRGVRGPSGVSADVDEDRYRSSCDIQVLMWHGVCGYWGGLANGGASSAWRARSADLHLSDELLKVEPSLALAPFVTGGFGMPAGDGDEGDGAGETAWKQLYARLHGYLARCRVDGCKIDGQAALARTGPPRQVLEALRAMQQGLPALNCMCHSVLFSYEDAVLARASDDFWPADPGSLLP